MSTRKYESGYSKLKKKKRIDNLIQSQKGALNQFVTSNKQNITRNEQEIDLNELEDNEIVEQKDINEDIHNDSQILDEEHENINETTDYIPTNIYDPSQWTNIDTKLRDLLVEKGPIRDNDLDFPKDEFSRHFSATYYIRKLPNGEKHDRKWRVYSKDFDRVFCFCCKLFNSDCNTSKLANEGTKDWRNLGVKLKSHETTNEHITNMNTWIDLEIRLLKNKTIDKNIQEKN